MLRAWAAQPATLPAGAMAAPCPTLPRSTRSRAACSRRTPTAAASSARTTPRAPSPLTCLSATSSTTRLSSTQALSLSLTGAPRGPGPSPGWGPARVTARAASSSCLAWAAPRRRAFTLCARWPRCAARWGTCAAGGCLAPGFASGSRRCLHAQLPQGWQGAALPACQRAWPHASGRVKQLEEWLALVPQDDGLPVDTIVAFEKEDDALR